MSQRAARFSYLAELRSVDETRRRRRQYRIRAESGLWGFFLTKSWGRIGSTLRHQELHFDEQADLEQELARTLRRRVMHGYEFV